MAVHWGDWRWPGSRGFLPLSPFYTSQVNLSLAQEDRLWKECERTGKVCVQKNLPSSFFLNFSSSFSFFSSSFAPSPLPLHLPTPSPFSFYPHSLSLPPSDLFRFSKSEHLWQILFIQLTTHNCKIDYLYRHWLTKRWLKFNFMQMSTNKSESV